MNYINIDTKGKKDWATLNKDSHHKRELKKIKDIYEIIVERKDTHQTNVGAMESQNLMENVRVVKNLDIDQVNAQRKPSLKDIFLHATKKVINI